MLRQTNTRSWHWADKTMSVLRANQLEACEKDLASLPFRCLFDADFTDQDAEIFYNFSYYPREDRKSASVALHTVEDLRVRVLSSFAAELGLLCPEEHNLLVKLCLLGGKLVLQDWNDLLPARSLVRRLWCRVRQENGFTTVSMPHQLCASALLLLAGDSHKAIREAQDQVQQSIDDSLYLMGMIEANAPMLHLRSLLKETYAADRTDLIERMLFAGCDYYYDHTGRLFLLHPGLADPEAMLRQMPAAIRSYSEMSGEEVLHAAMSVDDLETPLFDNMLFSMVDAVRPEITPEDAVEDLIILAKQGVAFGEMKEVLSSLLVSLPTPDMLKYLQDICDRVPRWIYFSSSRLQ